jgi:hypothetical protein
MWPPARDALDPARSCGGGKIPEAFETTHNLAGLITSAAIAWGRLREAQKHQSLTDNREIDTSVVLGLRLGLVF